MKSFRIALIVSGLVSLVATSGASAAMMGMVKPEILGGVNYMTNTGAGLGYTVGLDLDFMLGPVASLDVGGQYLSRAFTGLSNVNYIQIPAIFRFHMGPMFSIGGGGFYDAALTSGAGSNYGVTGALKIKPMLAPIFLEGRFNYGLNTTNFSQNTTEIQGLVGFVL